MRFEFRNCSDCGSEEGDRLREAWPSARNETQRAGETANKTERAGSALGRSPRGRWAEQEPGRAVLRLLPPPEGEPGALLPSSPRPRPQAAPDSGRSRSAPPFPPGARQRPRPSRVPAAAKWGRFCDAVTAKWCDRRSLQLRPLRPATRGQRRLQASPGGSDWADGVGAGGRRRRRAGGKGEPAMSALAPRRSPWTGRSKPRRQQGLRLHEALGFFVCVCVFFLFSLRSSPPLPGPVPPSPFASGGRVQVRSPERSAMASNPERGEILLTELQVRAAARVRGAGGEAERGNLARGRGPMEALRPPRPSPAQCGNLGMSLGSRFLREPDPPPPRARPAAAFITYRRDPVSARGRSPQSAVSQPRAARSPPPPGCQSGGLPPRRPLRRRPAPPRPRRTPLLELLWMTPELLSRPSPSPPTSHKERPHNFQPPDKFVCVCGCFLLLLVLFSLKNVSY